MTDEKSLSILIITYNRCADCLELLQNIERQVYVNEYVGEILLLNNNSADSYNAVEVFVENTKLPIKYINHNENLGVAGGRNFLISKALFPHLLILDDDVLFEKENAISTIALLFDKLLSRENNTAVITLNIFYHSTNERQKTALPHKNYEEYKNKNWFLTYYFTGAAHLMKKNIFTKTGLYPDDFFYGMEEYDLSYRIIDAGYTLAYDSEVKVLHKESPLGRLPNKEKVAMMWYNKSKVAYRYLPQLYFYSTAVMWSLVYLQITNFDWSGWWNTWRKITTIGKNQTRKTISKKALNYLKSVDARLWY